MKENLFMVFDVESVGLHGEGFAVGFVVVTDRGDEVHNGLIWCQSIHAEGTDESRKWVDEHVKVTGGIEYQTPKNVRDAFWHQWQQWKACGAILVTDCGWPVEARFLARCVDDIQFVREWEGPYPLHDLASVLLAKGMDPSGKFPRHDNELPEHNPLCDARQSARILIGALSK